MALNVALPNFVLFKNETFYQSNITTLGRQVEHLTSPLIISTIIFNKSIKIECLKKVVFFE